MLSLTRDVFARMAISTQRDRSLNTRFRFVHTEIPVVSTDSDSIFHKIEEPETGRIDEAIDKAFKEKLSTISLVEPEPPSATETNFSSGKIEDKIARTIDNPHLAQIQVELEFAEALLKKIKVLDEHNIKIPVIEETISRLKVQLEQKSYV